MILSTKSRDIIPLLWLSSCEAQVPAYWETFDGSPGSYLVHSPNQNEVAMLAPHILPNVLDTVVVGGSSVSPKLQRLPTLDCLQSLLVVVQV